MSSGLSRSLRAALVLPLLLAACAAPEEGNAPDGQLGTSESALLLQIDPCGTQAADTSVGPSYITLDQGESVQASTDAAYAYRAGCSRFLVDHYIDPNDLYGVDGVLISGSAHDLPSSSAPGGILPANALDCGQFRLYIDFWSKKLGASSFNRLQSMSFGGVWIANNGPAHCEYTRLTGPLGSTGEYLAKPAIDGSTWVYRTAVKVTLRGTAQQAASRMNEWEKPAY
jgi:hypothetical protein